jgi:hypothetical protein
MFLNRFPFSRTPALIGLVVVGLMWAARPAAAQQPLGAISKFDRANSPTVVGPMWNAPEHAEQASLGRFHAPAVVLAQPAVGSLLVTVKAPVRAEPVYVTLRGPDGEVQRYALEAGQESIRTRTVIVRQGETASFRFAAAAPPKGPELR